MLKLYRKVDGLSFNQCRNNGASDQVEQSREGKTRLKKVTDDLKALVLSWKAASPAFEKGRRCSSSGPGCRRRDDDDDVDLFGSSDEEESEEKSGSPRRG